MPQCKAKKCQHLLQLHNSSILCKDTTQHHNKPSCTFHAVVVAILALSSQVHTEEHAEIGMCR